MQIFDTILNNRKAIIMIATNTLTKYIFAYLLACALVSHAAYDPKQLLLAECKKNSEKTDTQSLDRALKELGPNPSKMDEILREAAANGHAYFVRALLECKIPADAGVEKREWSALQCAANTGRCEVISILIEARAHINLAECPQSSPLFLAIKNDHPNAVTLLLDNGAKKQETAEGNLLHLAALHESVHVAHVLIDREYDVNFSNEKKMGNTPLHFAISRSRPKATKILLAHRADPNNKNRLEQTPLYIAMTHLALPNRIHIIEILFAHDQDSLMQTTINLAPNLKNGIESLAAQVRQAAKNATDLLFSLNTQGDNNPLDSFLPNPIATLVVEYALTPKVYADYTQDKPTCDICVCAYQKKNNKEKISQQQPSKISRNHLKKPCVLQ